MDNLISISQAARLIGTTPQAVSSRVSRGTLPHTLVAGRRLLDPSDIRTYAGKGGRPKKPKPNQ